MAGRMARSTALVRPLATVAQQTVHLSPVWGRTVPEHLLAERGQGSHVHSSDGRKFLDFTCGIGVTNTGHCHPKVVKAIQDQATKFLHSQVNIHFHRPMLELVDELKTICPPSLDTFFFSNSGAEIVEGAIKLAKHATGRQKIVVFSGGFHGRTHLTMAMTSSKVGLNVGYSPLVQGCVVAPYPYAYHYGWDEDTTVDFCIKELKRMFKGQTAPQETAAMIIEPVLGEGGYVPVPPRFMRALREICTEHGIMLIADEVQSGFGRTGKWFGIDHTGVTPDIMTMAKGIASGMPLSALCASKETMAKWAPGSHGGTYGGNAVSCAAAVATIRAMKEEKMVENSAKMGERLMAFLRKEGKAYGVGDVRGQGLMIGVEFTTPDGKPWPERTKEVLAAAYKNELLMLSCGTFDNVVRLIPPINLSEAEAAEFETKFAAALKTCA